MRARRTAKTARTWTALVVGAALALALGQPALAQQPRRVLVRDVKVGLLDTHYHGWLPVQLQIENPGPSTRVEVVVKVTRRNDVVGQEVRQQVDLPSGANRRETVYVLVDQGCNQVDVEVLEGGRRLDGVRRALDFDDTGNGWRQPVHAILVHHDTSTVGARPLEWVSFNGDANEAGAVVVTSATADPASLPERPEGYDGIDLVALAGVGAADLAGDRILALRTWLERGGRVLLLPGENPSWFRDDLIRGLLPEDLRVTAVTLDKLPALKAAAQALAAAAQTPFSWPRTAGVHVFDVRQDSVAGGGGRLSREGSVLFEEERPEGNVALASVFSHGQGEVVLLGVDVDQPPFDRWPYSRQALSQALFKNRGRVPRERNLGFEPELRNKLAHALNVSEAPSPLAIVPAVILYILLVGPINQKLLRRYEAHVLIVATTPLVALVFTGVIFAMGYALTGLATVILRTTVIETRSGEAVGTERTAVSIHSSTSSTYKVAVDSSLLSTRVYPAGVDLEKQVQSIAVADGRRTWGAIPLNLWEHAFFVGSGQRSLGGGVVVTAGPKEITIANKTALELGKGLLVTRRLEGLIRVPRIPAGTKVTVPRAQPEGTLPVPATSQDAAAYWVEGAEPQKFLARVLGELADRVPLRGRPCYVSLLDASPSAVEVDTRNRATRDAPFVVVGYDEERP